MHRMTKIACVVALGGLVAVPAFADCQAEIKAAEDAAAKVTDAAQKANAEGHLKAAKDELAKGNEKACSGHATAASAALKAKAATKSPY